MGGWKAEKEAVPEGISGFKSLPINKEVEMGFFNLYFCMTVLILTEAVVSLADLCRHWYGCSYRNLV